jgi:hypothetical protein
VAVVALDVAPVLEQSWSVDVADPVLLQTIQGIQLCHSEPFCRTPALSQDPIEDAGLQEVQGLQEAPGFMGSVMHMGTAAMCLHMWKKKVQESCFFVLETCKN